MPNFGEVIISILVGWGMGMASTWLIIAKPWLDRRLIPPRRIPVQSTTTPALNQIPVQQQNSSIKVVP